MTLHASYASRLLVIALVCIGISSSAHGQTAQRPQVHTGEIPELGRAGALSVGTTIVDYDLSGRPKITMVGAVTGRLPLEKRRLSVRIWYPATVAPTATRMMYRHDVKTPGKPDFIINTQGTAVANAPALIGTRYPLVVLSHGYRGWGGYFSNLAENLASKGYVVAAIDHNDAAFDSAISFQMSFGNVMMDRTQDQRQIITRLLGDAAGGQTGFSALIDPNNVGLIGYSMGGFGALATAGAPYDATSKTIKQLPGDAQKATLPPTGAAAPTIKALVALAPWGGQPDSRSWNAEGLARITAPVLMISGDQDDVVNFRHGVSWIFDNLTGSDRHLLVYKQARHNIAGNAVPITATTDFSTLEFFAEPVWRTERINQINQHFIAAFLDLHLKGDVSKAAFLNVPNPNANQSVWPTAMGEQVGGSFAGAAQPKHWRGFQRRWAIGLEMQTANKGARGTLEPAIAP